MRIHRILPLLLLTAACSTDPLTTAGLNLQVQAVLSTDLPLALDVEVENRGSETVYLAACDNRIVPILQRREGGGWVDQNSAVCLANVSGAPVELAPGEMAEASVSINGAGEYRAGVLLSTERDTDLYRTANSGTVTVP